MAGVSPHQLIPRHRTDNVSQQIWRDTVSGKYANALYLTIMSKHSFENLLALLPDGSSTTNHLRVLTLDPSIGKGPVEAIARNLHEHKDTPWKALTQVRDAASQWLNLMRKQGNANFLTVRSYRSMPTMQGILVPDQFVLIELMPYGSPTSERPALLIYKLDQPGIFEVFAKAFEELWGQAEPLLLGEAVDDNTLYTQSYMELRRYRDYELTAAGWFGGLQLGQATVFPGSPIPY